MRTAKYTEANGAAVHGKPSDLSRRLVSRLRRSSYRARYRLPARSAPVAPLHPESARGRPKIRYVIEKTTVTMTNSNTAMQVAM
ncbi:hypothetical protein WI98_00725 [Burkholderia vietnamiensis]|nr:hypothetical protein WI98_00725 [Burkholderia vietnamiensis]